MDDTTLLARIKERNPGIVTDILAQDVTQAQSEHEDATASLHAAEVKLAQAQEAYSAIVGTPIPVTAEG